MNHPRIQNLSSISVYFKCIALKHLPSRCVGWTDVAFHNVSKGSANSSVFSSIDVCFGIKFVVWPTVDYSNVDLDIEAFVVMLTVDVPNVDLDGEAFVVMLTVDAPNEDSDVSAIIPVEPSSAISIIVLDDIVSIVVSKGVATLWVLWVVNTNTPRFSY